MVRSAQEGNTASVSRRLTVLSTVAALMALPVVAMGAVEEVGEVVFLCIMMAIFAAAYELLVRADERNAYWLGLCVAAATGLLEAWINLAVGIIGSENNPANLLYAGVLGVALLGALLARFRPAGMAVAMTGAAIAQALVFVAALVAGFGFTGPVTVLFTGLWLISASLFRKSDRASSPSTQKLGA